CSILSLPLHSFPTRRSSDLVGDGVSAPRPIFTPEPEFSEEARKAKYQGVVVLNIIVGTDGRVHNPRVVRSLGMGLDEKAIEGVKDRKSTRLNSSHQIISYAV